jgi:hypothetical protein
VCLLVASRKKSITNVEESYKNDVGKYLYESISSDVIKNNKLRILIEEFHKISLNHDSQKLEQALQIINELSDLLNSSK